MIIAVFSDSHDNIWNLNKALQLAALAGAEMLIHCGDYCAPFVLLDLARFAGQVHGVFGNVDGDKYLMTDWAHTKFSNITLHGDIGELDIAERKIAFVHSPKVANGLALTGEYEVVFYGHTHEKAIKKSGDCLLVNPGEIMGRLHAPSFCIYDIEKKEARHVGLD